MCLMDLKKAVGDDEWHQLLFYFDILQVQLIIQ